MSLFRRRAKGLDTEFIDLIRRLACISSGLRDLLEFSLSVLLRNVFQKD